MSLVIFFYGMVNNNRRRRGVGVRPRRLVVYGRSAVYHVMSRVVRKQFWLDDAEREKFREMLGKQADFAGVEVLTYCLMGNHFHLLVRVPESPLKKAGEHLIDDAELLRRYRRFYGDQKPRSSYSVAELEKLLASEDAEEAELARCRVLARMGDLSEFMKELKQRFGIWFNDRHKNVGTIWCDRFKSILVEDEAEVLSIVGAYIDLNPVRAKMVGDPKDYRWSGFGEAMAGGKRARDGLIGLFPAVAGSYEAIVARYRTILYGRGEGPKRGASDGNDAGCIDPAIVEKVLNSGGKVALHEALICRWRYFSAGKVLGSAQFAGSLEDEYGPPGRKRRRPSVWSGFQLFQRKVQF